MKHWIQGSDAMFKIAIVFCFVTLVCGQTPPPKPSAPAPTPSRPKQFRYVDDEESPARVYNNHQRQEAAPHQYVVPNAHPVALQDNQPGGLVPPLVDVNTRTDDTGTGKKVDVGVNVG